MFRNQLLLVWRNLLRNKLYSIITITGLAVGIAAGFLILQYVYFETSYDTFFENKENIYRVQLNRYNDGELSTQWAAGCAGAGYHLKEEFPEVLDYVTLTSSGAQIGYEEEYFKTTYAYYATGNFFEVFSIPLIRGVDSLVLKDPYTVVLSQTLAEKIFGQTDPVGKNIKMNDATDFLVTGVFADLPERSHMKFDLLYSFESFVRFTSEEVRTAWQWDGFLNYVVLRPGSDPAVLAAKFPGFIEKKIGQELAEYNAGMELNLQPLTKIHLISDYRGEIKPTGDEKATYFLLIIGLFVLFIAWINYVNLTTAHSLKRAREVGIRKVLGGVRNQLIRQFLFESSITNALAFMIAFLIVVLLFPVFNHFVGRESSYTWPDASWFWLGMITFFAGGILLSGFYPSLVLSNFRPVTVLKGKFTSSPRGNLLRKGLVTFQFLASIFLITGTYVVYRQLEFLQNQDLGVRIKQTLAVYTPNFSSDSVFNSKDDIFSNQLRQEATVTGLTASSTVPGRTPDWNAGGIRLINQTDRESNQYRIIGCDDHFMEFYGLETLAGRSFDGDFGGEQANVIFNEAAVHRMGLNDPKEILNQKIYFWGDTFSVIGVVKNYRQESPKSAYDALIFRYFPHASGYYSIQLNTPDIQESLNRIESHWNTAFQNKPFEYFFLDEYYNEQYKAEIRFGSIFGLFAGLAIFVASLGLFGMASYITQLRAKEVGVRKVLGASLGNLWSLLTFDFMKWVLLAILLAIPLNWLVLNQWLDNFANRISLSIWLFIFPAVILLFIATSTVSFYTLKTANQNPSRTLKEE